MPTITLPALYMLPAYYSKITTFKDRLNRFLKMDISLLLIMIVVVQHSFPLRFGGLLLVTLLNLDTLRRTRLKELPLFYLLLPLMELIRFLLANHDFSQAHTILFAWGMAYWIAALLVCALLYGNVKKGNPEYVHRSIGLYTLLNLAFSAIQYSRICIAEQVLNPYNTGHDHPYGVSSGDLIHGLPGDVHIVNAFICLFLVIYYVSRQQKGMTMAALVPLLLTGSNYATLLLMAGLFCYWLFSTDKRRVGLLSLVVSVSVLFYVLVSTENAKYLSEKLMHLVLNRPIPGEQYQEAKDNFLNTPEGHWAVAGELTVFQGWINRFIAREVRIDTADYFAQQKYTGKKYDFGKMAGKKIAYRQTFHYLGSSWQACVFGAGMGGFSSKLAFNFSGVMEQSAIARYLPAYETPLFRDHHKSVYAYLKTRHVMMHSESNRPFSTYNQLLGEYGITGLLGFLVFYTGYFLRRVQYRGYALPLILVVLMMLHLDYFIESLNVLVFFELLLFINIRQKNESAAA